jgi:lysophospholipase L1-like esterase
MEDRPVTEEDDTITDDSLAVASSPSSVHRQELRHLLVVLVLLCAVASSTYLFPGTAEFRPWLRGEPIPVLHLLTGRAEVRLDSHGELSRVDVAPTDADDDDDDDSAAPSPGVSLPERPPARSTAIEFPDALVAWFGDLAMVETGEPGRVVRTLHWGDSTIAGDGITRTVRARFQDVFGDGGPGFLPVHTDVRWQLRPGVLRTQGGTWTTYNITHAGAAGSYYGLAGNISVSSADEPTRATLGGLKLEGKRQLLHRFVLHYRKQPEGGTLTFAVRGARSRTVETASEGGGDRFLEIEAPRGARTVGVRTAGDGPVSVFGIALETEGPGVTWETFGVAGSSVASMLSRQGSTHLKRQVAKRAPSLLVYQTGGNELSYPMLHEGEGEGYERAYSRAMAKLRAGAPEASCLVIAPLDQGIRSRGQVTSKPQLERIIRVQRRTAKNLGCAFWDARAVMGGAGSFARWIVADPKLASTDLLHLTSAGLELMGHSLADALLAEYERWRADHPDLQWVPEDVEDRAKEPSKRRAAQDWEAWVAPSDASQGTLQEAG